MQHISALDFDTVTREELQALVLAHLKSVVGRSSEDAVSIVEIVVPNGSNIVDVYTLRVVLQLRIPAHKADVVMYKIKSLQGETVRSHRIEITEAASVSGFCVSRK